MSKRHLFLEIDFVVVVADAVNTQQSIMMMSMSRNITKCFLLNGKQTPFRAPCPPSVRPYDRFINKASFCSSSSSAAAAKFGFVGWYLRKLEEHPIVTKSLTSSFIFTASDFTSQETSKYPTKRNINGSTSRTLQCCSCYKEISEAAAAATTAQNTLDSKAVLNCVKLSIPETSLNYVPSDFMKRLVLADLDPATAKLAIGFLGPFLSAFGFLFTLRIVMSWYPKLPVGKFPYVIAYAPTEPLLIATRKLIPPLAGVDVTPVVWFGLLSFLNEILVGPQGLLVLLSQQVN